MRDGKELRTARQRVNLDERRCQVRRRSGRNPGGPVCMPDDMFTVPGQG